MGNDDLGHHRGAKDGHSRSCNAHQRAAGAEPGRRRSRVGHILRYSPLRRLADLSARDLWRRVACPFQRRRAGRRSSCAAGAHGVTHLSGTPSQWRHALMMMPANEAIAPRYVRLSGEIADQAVLDSLRAAFPDATIGHAYASTEAGVVFDVNDGLAGFPTNYVGTERDGVTMKILDGTLRIRSCGAAKGYLGGEPLLDAAGFVDSGDIIEQHGERFYFAGRKGGIINIGGLKVHPEEIEAVIKCHPCV